MNKLFLLSLIAAAHLVSCTENKPTPKQETPPQEIVKKDTTPMMPGGDSDEHGCKGSAGYTWSVVKNECIRTFESGIRLDPKAANLDKTTSAFIVFKSDKDDAQAEIFLPSSKQSIVLEKEKKENASTWKNADYTLTQVKGTYSLEDAKKALLYQGAVKK